MCYNEAKEVNTMKKRFLLLIAPMIALILECLPYGVIMYFATNEGRDRITVMRSYFDLLPFGYGTFGPLLAAVLTCVLLVLTVIYVFMAKRGLAATAAGLTIIAGLLSSSTVLYGIEWLSVINVVVTMLLLGEGVLLFIIKEKGT